MKIYVDFEFLELPNKPLRMISGAFVREDGEELYFINEDILYNIDFHDDLLEHEWLKANVLPLLPIEWNKDKTDFGMMIYDNVISPYKIRQRLIKFLNDAMIADPHGEIDLWGWYSAYDFVCYAQIFDRMIDIPYNFPWHINDMRQEWQRLGKPLGFPDQDKGLHNALADARHMKKMHDYLINLENKFWEEMR